MTATALHPWHSYRGHLIPKQGEFDLKAAVKHLSDMREPWPVYFDPRNDKYTTFPSNGLVYLGWYGPGATMRHLEQDTEFAMAEVRKVKLSEWLS